MRTALVPALVSPRPDTKQPLLFGTNRLDFAESHNRLNHNVFRYPAKFHPPVARALVERFSAPGETVLDPFCGSGTTLVEGLVAGRSVIGTDVDPLAVFVTAAKIRRYDHDRIGNALERIHDRAAAMRQADLELWGGFDRDIAQAEFDAVIGPLSKHVPSLPRMGHWFRRRATLQLAAIRAFIAGQRNSQLRCFLELCLASIIRNSSNADPVPVSGLEVTSHMKRKEEAGRTVDPYILFMTALGKTAAALRSFDDARTHGFAGRTAIADARHLSERGTGHVDCVVTSPPYLTAVDYYRRHTLEMYWLGLTADVCERRIIMPRYIGRDRVGTGHEGDQGTHGAAVARRRMNDFGGVRPERARAFHHYCSGMDAVLQRMDAIVRPGGNIVLVVGDVRFCGVSISMGNLLQEIAEPHLTLVDNLWYPLANRYMSYSRKNEADINVDHVLVFQRKRRSWP